MYGIFTSIGVVEKGSMHVKYASPMECLRYLGIVVNDTETPFYFYGILTILDPTYNTYKHRMQRGVARMVMDRKDGPGKDLSGLGVERYFNNGIGINLGLWSICKACQLLPRRAMFQPSFFNTG